jgi:DNA repair photolyase
MPPESKGTTDMAKTLTPVEEQAEQILRDYAERNQKFNVTLAPSQGPLIWQKPSSYVGLSFSYTFALYSGCIFGCSYCYVPEVQHGLPSALGGWGGYVRVRPHGVALLERYRDELIGQTLFMSATTDPYQWVERDFLLTRAALEKLAEMDFSYLLISTRSNLILRDLDILTDRRLQGRVEVGISISSDIPSIREKLEPKTPLYRKRFEVAKALRDHGIPVRVHAAPLARYSENYLRMISDCADWAWFDGADYGASKPGKTAGLLYDHDEARRHAEDARLLLGETRVGFGREHFGWRWKPASQMIIPLPTRDSQLTAPKRNKQKGDARGNS